MAKLTHRNCQDTRCRQCLYEHEMLGQELAERTGAPQYDHLGSYHSWLLSRGIEPETEWGWATDASFDEANIAAYVAEWLAPTQAREG